MGQVSNFQKAPPPPQTLLALFPRSHGSDAAQSGLRGAAGALSCLFRGVRQCGNCSPKDSATLGIVMGRAWVEGEVGPQTHILKGVYPLSYFLARIAELIFTPPTPPPYLPCPM